MTKHEIDVVKKFLKEVLCQLDAEYIKKETMESAKSCNMLGMTITINNGQMVDDDTLEWVKQGVLERYKRKKVKFSSIPLYAEVYIVGNPEHLEVTFYSYFPHEMKSGFTYYLM